MISTGLTYLRGQLAHSQTFLICLFFETGFLCVVLTVLELVLYAKAGLELTEIHLPLPPKS